MTLHPDDIFKVHSEKQFNEAALSLFLYQYKNNAVYKRYVDLLKCRPADVRFYKEIPFLPIQFFKTHILTTSGKQPPYFFESSGTIGLRSRHYYHDTRIYHQSFTTAFRLFYGELSQCPILALVPSYAERPSASLTFMLQEMIAENPFSESGFYHNREKELRDVLIQLKKEKKICILFGVSFALLDFVEKYSFDYPELIVIETGGMKGRRKEIVREALHKSLCKGFNVKAIHSEYGMTELFSQAYSKGNGVFYSPPWMKVLARDINDPLQILNNGHNGALNIIDLANVHSMAFIATEDIGTVAGDGSFTVSGRLDNSMARGCNLMV